MNNKAFQANTSFLKFISLKHKLLWQKLLWTGFLLLLVVPAHAQLTDVTFPTYKFNGDLRFRQEHVEKQGAAVSTYEQSRIRARLGANVKTEENTQLEFRFATGTGRVSTNQSLGNDTSSGSSTQAFANYPIRLDRANVDFAALDTLHLKLGRFANPFYQVGESDLVWDGDLNFDGFAAKYKSEGDMSVFVNTGFFWVLKDLATPRKDVLLGAVQTGFNQKISDKSLGMSLGYYAYSGMRTHQGLTSSSSTDGNTYETSGTTRLYSKSYKLVDLGLEFSLPVAAKNLTLFNHYVTNTKANPSPGYIVGFKWGSLKEKGDWNFNYDYRRVPEDCTVGAFTDGDSFGGGTNGYSHKISAGYQVAKSWNTALSYFIGKTGIMDGNVKLNRQLVQADLNVKF